MYIRFDSDNAIEGKYPIPSIQLTEDELKDAKEYVAIGQKLEIDNPVKEFLDTAKSGKLDDLSDTEYDYIMHSITMLASMFQPEEEGLSPAYVPIYIVSEKRNAGKDSRYFSSDFSKEYVIPFSKDKVESKMNFFLFFERLFAYVFWNFGKEAERKATIHQMNDKFEEVNKIVEEANSLAKEIQDLTNSLATIKIALPNEKPDDKSLKDIQKEIKKKNNKLVKLLNDADLKTSHIHQMLEILNQQSKIEDKSKDSAYNFDRNATKFIKV